MVWTALTEKMWSLKAVCCKSAAWGLLSNVYLIKCFLRFMSVSTQVEAVGCPLKPSAFDVCIAWRCEVKQVKWTRSDLLGPYSSVLF